MSNEQHVDTVQSELYVGIDLGTTNSVAATVSTEPNGTILTPVMSIKRITDLGPRDRPIMNRSELLPSAVYYRKPIEGNCELFVGDFAKKMAKTKPFAVALSIKSQMGQPKVDIEGFDSQFPDQTPEAISARVLFHIRQAINGQYFMDVKNAVITVPACFNSAQCEATLRAAEMAGFDVRNGNGQFRDDILLSEPEAVLYNTVNQIQNGKVLFPLDFSQPRNVLVYDIGGGTLDITLHTVCRDKENPQIFDIQPIATNRYSAIAGDTFDKILAEYLFEEYCTQLDEDDAGMASEVRANREKHMPYMMTVAEDLKLRISTTYQQLCVVN